jgi:hypothetical protein
MYPSKYLNSLF